MSKKKRLSVDVKLDKWLIREIVRFIIAAGMLVIFGYICYRYANTNRLNELLPMLTGMIGMIVGFYFAGRSQRNRRESAELEENHHLSS